MSSIDEIKTRLKKNWYQFVNENSKKFTNKIIDGSSPPSLFVGEYGYPHVRVGPMVPPYHGNTSILDKPELWFGKSMEEIVNYRTNLLKGTMIHDVNNISGKYIESLQDMALSKKEQFKRDIAKIYTCPVHAEVLSTEPGKCPKCNKDLTLSLKEQFKADVVKLYTCPMHPDITSEKPGKCPKCGMELVEKKTEENKKNEN